MKLNMSLVNNLLTSGHLFSENENLQKFRFAFLNILMTFASFTTFLNILASFFGVIDSGEAFEKGLLCFLIVNVFSTFLLRKNKSYYRYIVSFFILSSFLLFYFVLFTKKEDDFRLIAFFIGLFITYVLLGKKNGVILAVFIFASILYISKNYELGISSFSYATFLNFFFIFAGILYFFFQKVERDSSEFEILNNKLKEKVKQETDQRLVQEQMLLRQCRMANMGEMIDSIAHQWRQPLMHINSILLNMETALETKETKKLGNHYLEHKIDEVATLTSHMSQTIEDFRGLFKVGREYTNFTLQDVIDDVLALLSNNLNNIELEYHSGDEIPVLGHRSELMQVIIILLSNAIEVINSREIEDKKIIIAIKTSDKAVLICIEDNAGGINPESIDVIFDPYITTKQQSGGTGLGLYIAKIIVEHNMHGTIVASNTSSGAKFIISLIKGSLKKDPK